MKASERRHDIGWDLESLSRLGCGVAVRRNRLGRDENPHGNDILEGVGFTEEADRHLYSSLADCFCVSVETYLGRSSGGNLDALRR